jgi:uncharacterized protein (TIGR03118 family)
MNTRRSASRITAFLASTCAILLAACGGGYGGGGGGSMSPPSVTIAVAPTTIVLGQSATLTWTNNSGGCTASDGWTGDQAASGTLVVTPAAVGTVTYTLTCSGTGYNGSTAKSATLTVTAASAYSATNLVGDTVAAGALVVDPNLVNPWGITFGPTSPVWVANNHTETSTLYNGNGVAQALVVAVPAGFDPTGIVFNSSTDFVVTSGANSGVARFIYSGEGGMLAGWSPTADPANAISVYTAADGAVYKGLAIANNGTANFLYATDFVNGKVDVFDTTFAKQATSATSFTFLDPNLPAGYSPFGIQALKTGASGATQIYVTYAMQQNPPTVDNANGAGLGIVDVYDTNGQFVKQLVAAGGWLNAPWGVALAPADFGTLSGAVLVGNFGDGKISGYDPATGTFLGQVTDSTGTAWAAPGLWGISFGNDAANQPHATLFFAAGTNDEANGLYGRIDLGATAPMLGAPPVVTLTAPAAGNVTGTVAVTATAVDALAIAKVELFANGVSLGAVTSSPYTVQWDTTAVANGSYSLKAIGWDVNGNVATSSAVTVTVANVAAATTLTQLQATYFGPICSGCHNGTASTTRADGLPGIQNLTTGADSFAALVNVASLEVSSLNRVTPNDADNSYIIQKLEGTAAVGARMPFGGPYLTQTQIDQFKSWINAGATNN